MNQKLLFIINPHAGKGAIQNSALGCIDIFVKAGFDVMVYTTQKPLDATNIVIERAAQFDRVVCAGGDGTLNEVVTGLLQHTDRIPLGYIPAGTVNDFASSLDYSQTSVGSRTNCCYRRDTASRYWPLC